MPSFKISENIRRKSISWLQPNEETKKFLKEHNFKTVRDVIRRQDEIPKEMFDPMRMRLLCDYFNIEYKEE